MIEMKFLFQMLKKHPRNSKKDKICIEIHIKKLEKKYFNIM